MRLNCEWQAFQTNARFERLPWRARDLAARAQTAQEQVIVEQAREKRGVIDMVIEAQTGAFDSAGVADSRTSFYRNARRLAMTRHMSTHVAPLRSPLEKPAFGERYNDTRLRE